MERLENLKELVTLAAKYDLEQPPLGAEALLADAALATDQDSLVKNQDAVKLMTVHASKGLEFDYVFISGLEDGLFPHQMDGKEKDDEEEERRLFYVALTRARKKVFLTYAGMRTIFGSKQMNAPSEFLIEMDDGLVKAEIRTGPRKTGLKTIYFD
jgi:DNA helicase-2/ATP-dependent DNA helicase PcrA